MLFVKRKENVPAIDKILNNFIHTGKLSKFSESLSGDQCCRSGSARYRTGTVRFFQGPLVNKQIKSETTKRCFAATAREAAEPNRILVAT